MATKKGTTKATEIVEEVVKESTKYTKSQITGSKKFRKEKDLLNALLEGDTLYTMDEVDGMLNTFKKGKVK